MNSSYEFTIDMGNSFRATCKQLFLEPCFEWTRQPINYLEIGVYEGMSGCWMLDNILAHLQSRYTGIDLVIGHEEAHERAIKNLSRHTDKVRLIRGNSRDILPKLTDQYDIIYIDGCHSYESVHNDVIHCWKLLKKNGIVILDDYLREDYGVAQAIHTFLSFRTIKTEYQIVYCDYQIAIRKNCS